MKLAKFLKVMMAMAMITPIATSCGDDDDDDNNSSNSASNIAENVVGTYVGSTYMALSDTTIADTIVVTKTSNNTIKLVSTTNDATISGITVSDSSSIYVMSQSADFYEEMKMSMGTMSNTYSSDGSTGKTLNKAVAAGTFAGKNLVFTYGGAPGAMPMVVSYAFTGVKE